jgi:hypothetical protein
LSHILSAEIYRGPVPAIVKDAVRRLTYFIPGPLWAPDINALLQNLRRPLPRVGIYANSHHVDLVAKVFQAINEEELRHRPPEDGVKLYDEQHY